MKNLYMHKAKILWIPAEQEYRLVCDDCGLTLLDDINGLTLKFEGECEGPDDAIGIEVSDGIGTEDHFGGAP